MISQVPVLALAESPLILITISDLFSPESYRFFETEGIAVLTMLVSRYKISIKEEPQFAHETFEERKARITATQQGITIRYASYAFIFLAKDSQTNLHSPLRVPLVFTRRK